MKRFLPVCLILCFLVILKAWSTTPMPMPMPSGNGDVNADGVLDLSDAVYLLTHIFRSGPEPVAIAQGPVLSPEVEAAILELAANSNRLPCRGLPDRMVDNGDGTVTDTCTGLMWWAERQGPGQNISTQEYDEFVQGLDVGGYTDWHLPSQADAMTLYTEGWFFTTAPFYFMDVYFGDSDGMLKELNREITSGAVTIYAQSVNGPINAIVLGVRRP